MCEGWHTGNPETRSSVTQPRKEQNEYCLSYFGSKLQKLALTSLVQTKGGNEEGIIENTLRLHGGILNHSKS